MAMDPTPILQNIQNADRQLLDENPFWRLVLEAYLTKTLEAAAVKQCPAGTAIKHAETAEEIGAPLSEGRWLSRLVEVDGVPPGELSNVYGKLIAHGFLTHQVAGRDGLVYMLSSLGLQGTQPADTFIPNEVNEVQTDVVEDSQTESISRDVANQA